MTQGSSSFILLGNYRSKEWLAGISVFLMSAIISASVIWHFDTMRINEMKHKIKDLANENSFYLYKKIDQMMALSYPISSTILEDGQTHDFESIAKKLIVHYPLISEIALAPDGVIRHVVPLSGNEKAVGFDLFTDPQQQSEALIARKSGKLTLAGPLNLVQGNEGIVGRLPIFRGEDKKFWGFVIIVVRFPDILHTNALSNLEKQGYHYSITRIHPKTKQLQVLATSGTKELQHPIETIIKLPNAQWKLNIAPAEGWHDHWLLAIGTAIGMLISLLLGYVAKQFTELRHHRYLLEKRVHERTSEISETKNQLHTLLDTIPDLIWLKNKEGVYLLCNPMFERFFGAKEKDIVGKTDYDFVDTELADFFRENDRLAMFADKPMTNEEWVTFAADGHRAFLETVKVPMYNESHVLQGVLGISRDITQRHNDELHIEQLSHLYAALSHCNKAIVRSSTPEELFQEVCKGIVSDHSITMAWIGRVDRESGLVRPVASYGDVHHYLDGIEISTLANSASGNGPTGTSIRENRPYWCQDFLNDQATAPWHERGKIAQWQASASLPFHLYGEVIGSFTVYSHKLHAFDPSSQALLIEMAMDISFAMENFDRETNRLLSEARLHHTEQLLEEMSAIAHIGGWEINPKTDTVTWTKEAAQIFEMTPTDTITLELGLSVFHGESRIKVQTALDQAIHQAMPCDLELQITPPTGNQKWIRIISTPSISDGQVKNVHGSLQDITLQKTAEEKVHWLAHFDTLTGLPNRTLLNDRMDYAMHIADRTQESIALLYVDLDHFKNINDTLGHNIGDELLIQVASRIQSVLLEEDTLSRQGGDEFMILLSGVDPDGAAHAAEKLIEQVSKPYKLQHHELSVTLSIGIALYPIDGKDFTALSQAADAAMFRAKHDGRNCYRFFTPEIQERSARNLELENALRQALARNELELYYQPQLTIETQQLIGAEALLRWNHPTLGIISPSEFIPIAEESGQIIAIGEWVLHRALGQLKSWLDEGIEPFIMAVNLSAVQFRHPKLVSVVLGILEELNLPPEYLELELTERIASENPLEAIEIMNTFYDHGIRMSIDDFGTGYSSLNYLKKFRVYKLKIDQSFIRDITENPEDETIVNTIINMAHSLNMITIAEGVETLEQLDLLRKSGCKEVQGFYFSKPLPAKEFQDFIYSLTH
jgi:diguanylate cyclase (GGDEF)-like protein/PAS domain S-box-containing protein